MSEVIEIGDSFSDYIARLRLDEVEIQNGLVAVQPDNKEAIAAWKEWLSIACPDWRDRFAESIRWQR